MAIKIGHASIDERGKVSGGQAGDQTGREIYTRSWYKNSWQFVLRCKDSQKAEIMAVTCEKGCNNSNIGYNQSRRNTLNTQAQKVGFDLSKITTPCETDCSAFMTICAQAAGINVPYNSENAPTTSTMRAAFGNTNMFDILTETKYLASDNYLKRGDILVRPGFHTVMVLGNGLSNSLTDTSSSLYTFRAFVSEVQKAIGAKVDGIPGKETLSKTITVSKTINNRHHVIKPIQKYLNSLGYSCGAVDGIAGTKFDSSIKLFQKENGCVTDGVITKSAKTWQKLLQLV